MANVNKVMLIGRLTRDPETRTFANGGKVTAFGFAVTNRKKNPSSGQWEDDPMFIDVKVFNRGDQGRQADLAADSLRKGHQLFVEGRLVLEKWEKDGQKHSKHVVVVDNFQFLERREDAGSSKYQGQGGGSPAPQRRPNNPPPQDDGGYDEPMGSSGGGGDEIPF